ncbi:MAG: sensor histidine kinase [Bilifractor sp.]
MNKKTHKPSWFSRSYGSLKIQYKLFLMIAITAAIPMLLAGIFFSTKLYRLITSDTLRQEQIRTAEAAPLLQQQISKVLNEYTQIRTSTFCDSIFSKTIDTTVPDVLTSESARLFSQNISRYISPNGISAVRIYVDLPSDSAAFTENNKVFVPLRSVSAAYWYGIFYSTHPSELFCPPLYLSVSEKKNLGDCAYIHPASILDSSGTVTRCYIACYFASSSLRNILTGYTSLEGSVSYITNVRDAMVTTTNSRLSGIYYMNYNSIQNNLMSSNGFLAKKVLGETVYVSYYYLPDADWFLVNITPSAPLRKSTMVYWLRLVLIWSATAALAICISVFLARSFTNRIRAVSNQMSQVKNGPPVPMDSPAENDEIGDLIDSYNYMARQINNLMEQQKKQSEELRIAEFRSLQAQINPHFLYNTMEMINWMAQQGRTKEIKQAVRDLSRFYRLTLSRKDSVGTLEDEIEHASIYVRLQNMRFDNGIDFVVDVPDEMMEYHIPRLTLQPIIENCILHGILEKESRKGTIVLTGWIEDGTMILLISDDGVGMSPEKVNDILTGKIETTGKGNHIAIYNTHRRLQILYGENYGLHYTSSPMHGTEVELRIPAYTDPAQLPPKDSTT